MTGHTGFKGGWLSVWLSELGAEVHGIALPPETNPNLFDAIGLDSVIAHNIQDIKDETGLSDVVGSIG